MKHILVRIRGLDALFEIGGEALGLLFLLQVALRDLLDVLLRHITLLYNLVELGLQLEEVGLDGLGVIQLKRGGGDVLENLLRNRCHVPRPGLLLRLLGRH